MENNENFLGIWKRIKLYEPKDILGPEEEQNKLVLWIQSNKNYFIDIRIFPNHEIYLNSNLKSFSGYIEYNKEQKILTWNRIIDFRPLGPPDLGYINFINENEIEEDGVLPGDDYKEIWIRITSNNNENNEKNITALISLYNSDDNHTLLRKGYFLIVEEYFAFTISRPILSENEQNTVDNQLKSYFNDGTPLSDSLQDYLHEYITIVGKTSDWKIQYSLQKELVGDSIESPNHCQSNKLKSILSSITWEFIDDQVPEIYSKWTVSSSTTTTTTTS